MREAREHFERAYLQQQLLLCNGKVGQLAKRVGMERTHLYRKLRALGVDFRQANRRRLIADADHEHVDIRLAQHLAQAIQFIEVVNGPIRTRSHESLSTETFCTFASTPCSASCARTRSASAKFLYEPACST